MARTPYQPGKLMNSMAPPPPQIGEMANNVVDNAGPVISDQINQGLEDKSPEEQADLKAGVTMHLQNVQDKVAQAPTDSEKQQIVEQEKQLLAERAAAGNRSMSSGEKIAMAILSAAPIVAASTNGRADPYAAAKGSNQIRQGMTDANNEAINREQGQKDVELEQLNKRRALMDKNAERQDTQKFELGRDAAKFKEMEKLAYIKKGSGTNPEKHLQDIQKGSAWLIKSNPKGIADAQSQIAVAEKLDALANSNGDAEASGFVDKAAMYDFIKGLKGTSVRADDRKTFDSAKGIILKAQQFPNNILHGSDLGPEGRKALSDVARIHAKAAMGTLDNVLTPAIKSSMKKAGFSDEDIQAAQDGATGGSTPFKEKLRQQTSSESGTKSYDNMSIEQLRAEAAKRGIKK